MTLEEMIHAHREAAKKNYTTAIPFCGCPTCEDRRAVENAAKAAILQHADTLKAELDTENALVIELNERNQQLEAKVAELEARLARKEGV